jgi:hypothetical protein
MLSSRTGRKSPADATAHPSIESVVWILVVVSTITASVAVWAIYESRRTQARQSATTRAKAEEHLSSPALDKIASMPTVAVGRRHRVLALLDPADKNAAALTFALESLSVDPTLHTSVTVFFVPAPKRSAWTDLRLSLAAACAERQGTRDRLLASRAGSALVDERDLSALAERTHLPDPSRFVECMQRRETASEISDGLWLARALNLHVRPGFVIDSTVLRGEISLDSVRVRLRH